GAEIARIKGDWERLEADWVRETRPELLEHYLDKARQTLNRGGADGDSDPALLAVRGLNAFDSGDFAEAEFLLGAAAQAALAQDPPLRPRAWLELARTRLALWLSANPWADGAALPADGADAMLALLAHARAASPQMLDVYHTYLRIWDARK